MSQGPLDCVGETHLPKDGFAGTLVGRAWVPADRTASSSAASAGPSPVWLRQDGVYDLSPLAPTLAQLVAMDPVGRGFLSSGTEGRWTSSLPRIGDFAEILSNTVAEQPSARLPRFLAPVDLQAIKACGVTFACSLLERVIEERAGGDARAASEARQEIVEQIGTDLGRIAPGSPEAAELKELLRTRGLWSQYLEVGLGPDAEVFTKAQPLSAVGTGSAIGIHPSSSWNNPEPEVVLVVDPEGAVRGATLGNDVNLRDIEGRSALLLGKAKDNNASCAIGPFVRLFDRTFGLDDVRRETVALEIEGEDGFRLEDESRMSEISRDVLDLVNQAMGEHHRYPDGMALFTGTLFAPTRDRSEEGMGFTHVLGDVVRIRSEHLGLLVNRVTHSHLAPPWSFGISALMKNLAQRGLL